jgi:hypothetical protein
MSKTGRLVVEYFDVRSYTASIRDSSFQSQSFAKLITVSTTTATSSLRLSGIVFTNCRSLGLSNNAFATTMKLLLVLSALAWALPAYAQVDGKIPDCAQSCVNDLTSGSSIGNCPSLDVKCICSSSSFLGNIACCLGKSCSASDQKAAAAYAASICQTAGVTVNSEVADLCPSGASASSTGDRTATTETATKATGTTATSSKSVPASTSTAAAAMNFVGASGFAAGAAALALAM